MYWATLVTVVIWLCWQSCLVVKLAMMSWARLAAGLLSQLGHHIIGQVGCHLSGQMGHSVSDWPDWPLWWVKSPTTDSAKLAIVNRSGRNRSALACHTVFDGPGCTGFHVWPWFGGAEWAAMRCTRLAAALSLAHCAAVDLHPPALWCTWPGVVASAVGQ